VAAAKPKRTRKKAVDAEAAPAAEAPVVNDVEPSTTAEEVAS
jgi:hypothetical protein